MLVDRIPDGEWVWSVQCSVRDIYKKNKNYDVSISYISEPFIQTVIRQPLFVAVVLYSYHYFVRNCGPAWMAGRKAFELRGLMLLYNAVQVAVNFGLLIYVRYLLIHMCQINLCMYIDSSLCVWIYVVFLHDTQPTTELLGMHRERCEHATWFAALRTEQVHGPVGHDYLCATQETESGHVPARPSSLRDYYVDNVDTVLSRSHGWRWHYSDGNEWVRACVDV